MDLISKLPSSFSSTQTGMIRTPEGDFVLKPLREDHIVKLKSSEDEVPTHIMYKLSPADRVISQMNSESK